MTSCLRSSNRMYTRSALGLYRISIVDLPFPVKDVDACGNHNISFDSEKGLDFFLLVVSAQARLVKVKDFALAQTAILCGNWTSAVDDVTIPTVMTQDSDPVASGFVASLARPGGNITGSSTLAPEISGKRLEK